MDAHLFRLFCARIELFLMGARIEKIQEPAPGFLMLGLYNMGKRQYLYFYFDKKTPLCFISARKLSADAPTDARIMRIRKYFNQKRTSAVVCQPFARRIWLMASGERPVWLCLDVTAGADIRFFDDDQFPVQENIAWPARDEIGSALANWREWPMLTPALRRTLALLEEREQWALMADLESGHGDIFYYTDKDGAPGKLSAWPLPSPLRSALQENHSEDVLAILEKAGFELFGRIKTRQESRIDRAMRKRVRQLEKILARLDQDERKMRALLSREDDALLIQANLWRLPCREKTALLTLEHGGEEKKIALDPRFDITGNMERFFHHIHRARRGLAMLAKRRAEVLAEREELERTGIVTAAQPQTPKSLTVKKAPPAIGGSLPKNVQLFTSPDGHVILRGKDAKGNIALRKLANPYDYWAHVENGPGAHVILKRSAPNEDPPEDVLTLAGSLAANKSWLCEAASASVMFAEVRHVKPARKGPAGLVTIDKIQFTIMAPIDKSLEDKR